MMKRLGLGIAVVFVLVIVSTAIAVAAFSGPPSQDTYVDRTAPTVNHGTETVLAIQGSGNACDEGLVTFMQWDLTGLTTAVASAQLTLTTAAVLNVGTATISLYETNPVSDAWDETTLVSSNAPAISTLIQTKSAPTAGGQTLVFDAAALATYLNSNKGGHVSLALKFTPNSNCDSIASLAQFNSKEATSGKPDLVMRNSNAVTLTTFHAADPALSWPLLAAAAGLIVLIVILAIVLRRRVGVQAR